MTYGLRKPLILQEHRRPAQVDLHMVTAPFGRAALQCHQHSKRPEIPGQVIAARQGDQFRRAITALCSA